MTITPLARLATAALALLVAATPLRAEDAHYLVKKAIGPTNPELRDMILAVYTAEESGDLLRLQIGFRNMGDKPAEAYGLLSESDFRLSTDGQARSIQPKAFAANLTAIVPPGGLKPGSANAGTVTFPKPAGSKLELLVAGFGPIGFELDKAAAFKPIVAAGKARTILVNTEMRSAHEQLALIPLAVRQIEIAPGAIHFDVAFLNRTRNTISAQSPVTGRDAKFVDGFGNVVSPSEVTPALAKGILPADKPWPSGADYPGRITFPLPHAHAAHDIQFYFPTYGGIMLRWDHAEGAYKIETSEQEGAAELAEKPQVKDDAAFAKIQAFLDRQARRLAAGQRGDYLAGFRGTAQREMSHFLDTMEWVPVEDIRFEVVRDQAIDPTTGGAARNVEVTMTYHIKGLPEDNQFRASLRADFVPEDGGGQAITGYTFTRQPPFWTLGYTGVRQTDHFLIFYRKNSISSEKIDPAAAQAEVAYQLAERRKLPLAERYAAFFIDLPEQFGLLTSPAAARFGGAASSVYKMEGGDIVPTNRAMYINDASFLNRQRFWGEADRQMTITHELIHLALSEYTRPFTPVWVVEGMAVHFARQNHPKARQALVASGALNQIALEDLSGLNHLGLADKDAAVVKARYIYAGEVVEYLVDQFGEEKVIDFYKSFARYDQAKLNDYAKHKVPFSKKAPTLAEVAEYLSLDHLREFFKLHPADLDRLVKDRLLRGDR